MSYSIEITRDKLIERLQNTVPEFSIDPFWRTDFEEVKVAIGFLEMGLKTMDEYVHDLVSQASETLAPCQRAPAVQACFMPRLLDLWEAHLSGILRIA